MPIGNGAARVVVAGGDRAGRVEKILLEVVAEKTGYPVEMLEMGMSLDGDLGIDSIKRVEIFSALQGAMPDAPMVKPEDLGRLTTLGEIVAFLSEGEFEKTKGERRKTKDGEVAGVQIILLEVVAEKTGYPVEMLEMGMSLDGDLGIDSIKRVEIFSALQGKLPGAPVVKPEDLGRLQTLAEIVAFLSEGVGEDSNGHTGILSGIANLGERGESLSAPLSMAHGMAHLSNGNGERDIGSAGFDGGAFG